MRSHALLAAALFSIAALAAAQQTAPPPPPPASTITVDAKLVIVPATVRDKHGALLTSLTRENFALQVDGKPQTIRYFDHDNNVPLTIGLLIDTSLSQRNVLDSERSASSAFLDKMLAPERDKAFILQFARTVTLLQDVTASRPKLQQALKQVDTAQPTLQRAGDASTNSSDPQQNRRERIQEIMAQAGTALYDAVFLASDDVIAKQPGRRALILLTDGADHGSLKSLPQAIESAQRADTIVYAIYYKDDHPAYGGGRPFGGGGMGGMGGRRGGMGGGGMPGGGGQGRGYGQQVDGKKILQRLCGETGGQVFEVSKKDTLDSIYTQIGEELRAKYRLGFTPSTEAASEGYHQIDLTLTGPGLNNKDRVQTRDGYYRR